MENYAIAIGGTGARCMESLVQLCASGLGPDELFLLVIDPDEANGNIQRLRDTITRYCACRQQLGCTKQSPIFKTKLEFSFQGEKDFLVWSPVASSHGEKNLREYLRLDNLSAAARGTEQHLLSDMARLLYSQKELDLELEQGFRGRASVGAPVMAKIKENLGKKPWFDLLQGITQRLGEGRDVKVFVMASIFGATGACGFPTIATILRDASQSWASNEQLFLGGSLLLPYFSFKIPPSQGGLYSRPENFLLATKAALKHYSFAWQDGGPYDAMYFIGDRDLDAEGRGFALGGQDQRNACHYVEWLSALAANNFFDRKDLAREPNDRRSQTSDNGRVNGKNETYYAGRAKENILDWSDLPDAKIKAQLLFFTTFAFAHKVFYSPLIAHESFEAKARFAPWYVDHFAKLPLSTDGARNVERALGEYLTTFLTWLTQTHSSAESRQVRLMDHTTLQSSQETDFLTLTDNHFRRLLYSDPGDPLCQNEPLLKYGFDQVWEEMCKTKARDVPQLQSPAGKLAHMLYGAAARFCKLNYSSMTEAH